MWFSGITDRNWDFDVLVLQRNNKKCRILQGLIYDSGSKKRGLFYTEQFYKKYVLNHRIAVQYTGHWIVSLLI